MQLILPTLRPPVLLTDQLLPTGSSPTTSTVSTSTLRTLAVTSPSDVCPSLLSCSFPSPLSRFSFAYLILSAMSTTQTVQWVVDATNAARSIIGTSKIITHAPQPPYFGMFSSTHPLFPSRSFLQLVLTIRAGNYGWADGYGKIYDLAPHIDFFLVQFYNNGPTTSYETVCLLLHSSLPSPSPPYISIDLLGTRILNGCFRHGDQPWRSSPQQDRSW